MFFKTLNKTLKSDLLKGMFIYSIGTLGSKAINLAIYPMLTFFLLKSELGYYDLIVNTIYLVIPIATFQLADGVFRTILPLNSKSEKKIYISNGVKFILSSLSIVLLILYLIFKIVFSIDYAELIVVMAFLFGTNQSAKQIVRGLRKNKNYIISDIIYSFCFVLFLSGFLYFYQLGMRSVFYSFIIANVFSIMYLLLSTNIIDFFDKDFSINVSTCKELFSYSAPLITNSISWWMTGSINTWIILFFLGLDANGLYGLAFKFSSIIYLFNKIFSLAWQDNVIMQKELGKEYNSKIFNKLLFFLISTVTIITIVIKPLLSVLVSPEYFEAWKYVPWLLMATVFSSISAFFGAFYLKWRQTNKIFTTTILGSLTTITLSFGFTYYFGLLGAAIAFLAGFFVISMLRFFDTKSRLQLNIKLYLLLPIAMFIIGVISNYYI